MKNQFKLYQGDNIQSLKKLPDNSIDSVVTDPPYALTSIKKRFGKEGAAPAQYGTDGAFQRASKGFMGKEWDAEVPTVEFWKEVYRVLKPGGHILSFGGTRTYHRMVVNIEDAGFEIRDQIMWLYGSGFPKSHNIGKAVDKIQGNEREVVGKLENYQNKSSGGANSHMMEEVKPRIDIEITKGTSTYEGWGTGLKPANEPICLARKPLSEKSVGENVLKWGTGGINIDGCRIEGAYGSGQNEIIEGKQSGVMYHNYDGDTKPATGHKQKIMVSNPEGRFPANIILDESAAELLDEQSGVSKSSSNKWEGDNNSEIYGKYQKGITQSTFSDKGGASRYFFNVKNGGGTEDFFIYKENNIIVWNIKSLDTQEYNTEENIEASDALKQARESICQKPELYGNNTSVRYLTNTISITKMKTHSIMTFPILNASTKTSIGHFTLMIDEKQSQLLTEESILNVQIVSNQNALVSSIKTSQEVLVDIVSYVLEENLKSGDTTIENTITNTTENIGSNRFQYIPKVSKKERNMGLDGFEEKNKWLKGGGGSGISARESVVAKNNHPTVKPINLMTYLCRLITPKNGIILDPYMGSGSTGISAQLEGFRFVGMEMDSDYFKIAEARIENWEKYRELIK